MGIRGDQSFWPGIHPHTGAWMTGRFEPHVPTVGVHPGVPGRAGAGFRLKGLHTRPLPFRKEDAGQGCCRIGDGQSFLPGLGDNRLGQGARIRHQAVDRGIVQQRKGGSVFPAARPSQRGQFSAHSVLDCMLLPRGARQTPPSQLSLLYIKLSLSVLRREGPECSSRLFEFSTDTVGSALENTPGSGPCGAGPGAGPVVCGWVPVFGTAARTGLGLAESAAGENEGTNPIVC